MTDISFEEVKEILKKSIDETNNINEALEKTVQFIYSKGYEDGSRRLLMPSVDTNIERVTNATEAAERRIGERADIPDFEFVEVKHE